MSTGLLRRNLLALSSRESNLSSRLKLVSADPSIQPRQAHSGSSVPVYINDKRSSPLHSLVNPEKEARRFAQQYPSGGYLIFLGFGGGYQIDPFLDREDVTEILIIESDLAAFKAILSFRDYCRVFLDPRVHLLVEPSSEEIRIYLLTHCFPALFGNIQVIPLRSCITRFQQFFSLAFQAIKESLGDLADDFTVQTTFGTRWFTNTLANMERAGGTNSLLPSIREAIITAAGPSLEQDLHLLPELTRKGGYLIATDTSYPVLRNRGIHPDAVISIDCQHISYYHFLSGLEPSLPLVLDLASPPLLARLSLNPVFFTSGHPFSLFLNHNWRSFPHIDTSGGNVTHAAISLAEKLGAQRVSLLGADYCYPKGKSYSRGTYIYPYFQCINDRKRTNEHSFYDFVFKNSQLLKTLHPEGLLLSTKPMRSYRERLTETLKKTRIHLVNHSPYWEAPEINRENAERHPPTLFGAGPARQGWRDFLKGFLAALNALPQPNTPTALYLESLAPEERTLWLTLLPALARLQTRGTPSASGAEGLKQVREWSCNIIRRYL